MSALRSPSYAFLLADGVHCAVTEFSAAGLTLLRHHAGRGGLRDVARGEECAVTLCLGDPNGETNFDVVIRKAAVGPSTVEFAFVMLPPEARRLLAGAQKRMSFDSSAGTDRSPEASAARRSERTWRPAPFAFSRVEEVRPGRRIVMAESEAVLALTQRRSERNGPAEANGPAGADGPSEPAATAKPPATPVVPDVRATSRGAVSASHVIVPAEGLYAYLLLLASVLALFWVVVVG